MKRKYTLLLAMYLLAVQYVFAFPANPVISRNKTVYTSSGNKTYLTDNVFGGSTFSVYNNCWFAINVGSGPTNVYFNWNNPAYSWSDVIAAANSCKYSLTFPQDYTIQTSSNSTNGSDGSWTTVVTVTGSNVTARGHAVAFSGKSWIKMNITRGGGTIDELEVFNTSSGLSDAWFFPGTSITANTYKGTPPAQRFADLINQKNTAYNPIMVRGGIPCINSSNFANDINQYLNNAGNVKYWAIEMGTNDAWGGSNASVNTFKNNLQTVINACKNAGITPVIARMIGTNSGAAGWQVHPDYLTAIDNLTSSNGLMAGPDLYGYFTSHTSELNSDGVHPNATGAASIQRLWADKMASLYTTTTTGSISDGTYRIIFRHSGLSLNVEGNSTADGGNVVQWGYSGGRNEQWFVRNLGNSQYSIINANSGRGLDVSGASTADGADINQWYYSGNANQKWRIESVGSGYYRVVNVNSSNCIDMYGSSTAQGSPINQYGCNGGNNQSFTFTKLSSAVSRSSVRTNLTVPEIAPSKLSIYPNPSNNTFTINGAEAYSYKILNATGAIMENGKGNGRATVGGRLISGVYIIEVNAGKTTSKFKLVKN